MACKFTEEHRLRIVEGYYHSGESVIGAVRHFNTWKDGQPNAAAIPRCNKRNVQRLMEKFRSKKTLQMAHKGFSGRPREARTEARIFDVLREMDGARTSVRQVAANVGISPSTVARIAKCDLHLHPYRVEVKHGLMDVDFVQRTEACHHMLQELQPQNPTIVFVDEATFRTDGTVNLWNDRRWEIRGSMPDIPPAGRHQNAQRTTVLAAFCGNWLGGPYFFPGTVTAAAYRDTLQNFMLPDLAAANAGDVWFLQDGAPAHTALETRNFLLESFGADRLIGRFFDLSWPSRSPDLNPVDFFLWGFLRDRVFARGGFLNLHQLNAAIVEAFDWTRAHRMDAVRNAANAFLPRLQECIDNDGRQLRHR